MGFWTYILFHAVVIFGSEHDFFFNLSEHAVMYILMMFNNYVFIHLQVFLKKGIRRRTEESTL